MAETKGAFRRWWDEVWQFKSMDSGDSAAAAWNAALEEAAKACEAQAGWDEDNPGATAAEVIRALRNAEPPTV